MRCVRRYMLADDTRETSNASNNDIVPKLSFSSPLNSFNAAVNNWVIRFLLSFTIFLDVADRWD